MTVLKFAFRNLVRLPWRTLLFFAIVFFIVLSVSASLFVYVACENAGEALDENYVFVASLVPRKKDSLALQDIGYCADGTEILSFHVSMSENNGVILGGAYMQRLPEKTEIANAPSAWVDEIGARLVAVENLHLVPSFFSGECTLQSGTSITEKGYAGERAELVIPWRLAEKYGVSVGDTLIRRYYRDDYETYIYLESEIVGIYKTSAISPDENDDPVYIPLAVAELDYATLVSERQTPTSELMIERADFVLKDRNAFEPLVLQAGANGLDFRRADLVFNNGAYDTLSGELRSITSIAMLVLFGVLAVGVSVLVFFTLYLCHARDREKTLLSALGMSRGGIRVMLAVELLTVAVCAFLIGGVAGYFTADAVCGYVNDSVLTDGEISSKIEGTGGGSRTDSTSPLEQNVKIEISVRSVQVSASGLTVNETKIPREDEIGVSRHLYYRIGNDLTDMMLGKARVPTSVVGITDMSAVKTTVWDESFSGIRVFVSEDFDMGAMESNRIFLTPYDQNGYVSLKKDSSSLGDASLPKNTSVRIVGVYEENEYCSGNDLLVCMEDYHRLYSEFSITDESFFFERIGTVYTKNEP
ncbi:MAG: ABC transporter permease [Clostridia bacterium]|nr:ABC transporter permease [Clostridia bacterium]